MSPDPDESTGGSPVWPASVRYPVIVVLAAAGLIGIIAVLYDGGWLPLAGPFVAVVVASVIVFFVMWWRSRRLRRLSLAAAGRLRSLGPAIERERALPAAERPTGASDQSLEQAAQQVGSALQRLAWGHEQGAVPVMADLAANARRSWAPDAPMTREVEEISRTAQQLDELVRRMLAAAARRQR